MQSSNGTGTEPRGLSRKLMQDLARERKARIEADGLVSELTERVAVLERDARAGASGVDGGDR